MLNDNEIKIIDFLKKKENKSAYSTELSSVIPETAVFSLAYLLKDKGYVSVKEEEKENIILTKEGEERLKEGLPEDNLINFLKGESKKIQEVAKTFKDFNIALSWARKKGLIKVDKGEIIPLKSSYVSPEYVVLKKISSSQDLSEDDKKYLKELESRGLIEIKKNKVLLLTLLKEPEIRPTITYLTPELLRNKEWTKYELKEYNVEALPPFIPLGKKHYFKEFLEHVKDVMVSLGFKEVKSDFVEMEFYNFDMLFQAQDHPAREIHDSFKVDGKGELLNQNLVKRVKEVHEKWWKYSWNQEVAKSLVLRSQTTATTARVLSTSPNKEIKVFTIGKVFRPDAIDATHLIEFHQLDGLVIEENFNFRELLSTLRAIFSGIGIKEVKFKPAYFPFTEPSVEVYGFIQGLGWVEMAGAGLLRPEVTEPAGVTMPAGAWGLGLDRLAMLFLGIKDIRNLYSDDIEYLRNRKVEY
jgi:phenylalanyl-tRNA synthetase alpha chain